MPTDLVTGATGLVGNNLVRRLVSEHRMVRILVRKTSRLSVFDDLAGLQIVQGDITDVNSLRQACAGVENIYHLAADVTITRRMTDQIWRTNVTGTENILTAQQECGISRLVYCSTVDAIGLPEGEAPSTEDTPWNWDRLGVENAYARSKFEAHQRVLKAARSGVNAVLVCPGFMFGAYDSRPSSGKLIQAIAQRRLPGYPGGGNNFVDVEDVIQAMLRAASTGTPGGVYILGGVNLAYKEIFPMIADVVGAPRPRFQIPYQAARLGGWIGDISERISGQPAELNSATVRVSYLRHYYDPAKAIRELEMPQTPIERAIERAANWMRAHAMLSD